MKNTDKDLIIKLSKLGTVNIQDNEVIFRAFDTTVNFSNGEFDLSGLQLPSHWCLKRVEVDQIYTVPRLVYTTPRLVFHILTAAEIEADNRY